MLKREYKESKMKTLYVSDLDGTLLQSNETMSSYTNEIINQFVEQGMLFSYATARSLITAHKVTKNFNTQIPVIVYNGAAIIDNVSNEVILSNFFDDSINNVLDTLIKNHIYPIVYSYINDIEKFSYIEEKCTDGMRKFIMSRQGDPRTNPVNHIEDLYQGNKFYISCIDDEEKLKPFYDMYKEQYHCIFQKDVYTHDQWLEFLPKQASKATAIQQLKSLLNCDRLVVFGDGKNDIDMFEIADECYAVENAVDELKTIATDIIESNNNDGVAKWLIKNYK